MTNATKGILLLFGILACNGCTASPRLKKIITIQGVTEVNGLRALSDGTLLVYGEMLAPFAPLTTGKTALFKIAPTPLLSTEQDLGAGALLDVCTTEAATFALKRVITPLAEPDRNNDTVLRRFFVLAGDKTGQNFQPVFEFPDASLSGLTYLLCQKDSPIWAVGHDRIWRSRDGGKNWTMFAMPLRLGLHRNVILTAKNQLIFAGEQRLLLTDTDLRVLETHVFADGFEPDGLVGTSANDVWIYGRKMGPNLQRQGAQRVLRFDIGNGKVLADRTPFPEDFLIDDFQVIGEKAIASGALLKTGTFFGMSRQVFIGKASEPAWQKVRGANRGFSLLFESASNRLFAVQKAKPAADQFDVYELQQAADSSQK